MTGFLGEIGKKIADRWAALLVIPGLLYLAAVTAAAVLGWVSSRGPVRLRPVGPARSVSRKIAHGVADLVDPWLRVWSSGLCPNRMICAARGRPGQRSHIPMSAYSMDVHPHVEDADAVCACVDALGPPDAIDNRRLRAAAPVLFGCPR
jgi:hypothetical protein